MSKSEISNQSNVTLDSNDTKAKRLTVTIPLDVCDVLQAIADKNGRTLSSVVSASILYFDWLNKYADTGYTIKAEKDGSPSKELVIIK